MNTQFERVRTERERERERQRDRETERKAERQKLRRKTQGFVPGKYFEFLNKNVPFELKTIVLS
jgi:hypothetical protein